MVLRGDPLDLVLATGDHFLARSCKGYTLTHQHGSVKVPGSSWKTTFLIFPLQSLAANSTST